MLDRDFGIGTVTVSILVLSYHYADMLCFRDQGTPLPLPSTAVLDCC
jgi:hypothetical protein